MHPLFIYITYSAHNVWDIMGPIMYWSLYSMNVLDMKVVFCCLSFACNKCLNSVFNRHHQLLGVFSGAALPDQRRHPALAHACFWGLVTFIFLLSILKATALLLLAVCFGSFFCCGMNRRPMSFEAFA